jgi:hypothetical protein
MAAVDAKMEEFRVLLVSYGTAASAEEELLGILATGALTPAMMHFLTAILGVPWPLPALTFHVVSKVV